MKAEDIIKHLMRYLPLVTDYFTDQVPVHSITSSGLLATVTTASNHGLSTGDLAHISGALVPNPITALMQTDGIAIGVTQFNHDLTFEYQNSVSIVDANEALYNGDHALLSVDNRKTFSCSVDPSTPATATGSPLLIEDLKWASYNGWHVITKVDDTTFTFPLERVLGSPARGDIRLKVRPRITGSVSAEEAIASYTKQTSGKLWSYVVTGDVSVSRERNEDTDAVLMASGVTEYRQLILQNIHVFVFVPATDRISRRYARDLCDSLLPAFCKTLLRVKFYSGFVENAYSGLVFKNSSFGYDENSFYIHEFVFESSGWVVYDDSFILDTSVAFRDVEDRYLSDFIADGEIKFEGNINLDEVPLT
jgi:hypothetical protein